MSLITKKINSYLYVIEFKQDDIKLKTSEFYSELKSLFSEWFEGINTDSFEYAEIYEILLMYDEFLAQFTDHFYMNINPNDELTDVWEMVHRFVRHNPPAFPEQKISVYDIDEIRKITPKKSIQNKITYQWQNNPDEELPELYSLMIDKYKLIAPETTYEQFKPIFTGQPIESISPIRWHNDNASELLYFIDRLEQSNQVKHTKKADYQRMIACFVKPDGNTFQAAFKNIKTNILINLSPDKQKAIDDLISNF